MDTDVASDIRLIRNVIGRKAMEIDGINDRIEDLTGDDVDIFLDLLEFLENDMKGYKAIVDDLRNGRGDRDGEYYEIASLSERAIGIYNDLYLPSLSPEDLDDEVAAMKFKGDYASGSIERDLATIGAKALRTPEVVEMLTRDRDFTELVGKLVVEDPEMYRHII
ncbi:MAG: hypothetical protein MJZ68_04925 [archaeon]|nr:hypothetical protein [archaeon]